MPAPVYQVDTGAAAFTSTTSAQTVIGVLGGADFGLLMRKYRIAFTGTNAANAAVVVRPFSCTFATNPPGTASTTATVRQLSGRTIGSTNISAAYQWTTEPTVKTYWDNFGLTPNGGLVFYDVPLGDEPETGYSTGFGIEITASATVGVIASLWFSRC